MAYEPSWLDKLLGRVIAKDGVPVPRRGTVDFVGPLVTVTDVPEENVTRVNVGSGGSGGGASNGSVLIVRDGELALEPLRPSDVGLSLQSVRWRPNFGAAAGGGTYLILRGTILNEIAAEFEYNGALKPDAIQISDVFTNGAIPDAPFEWTFDGDFVEGVAADRSMTVAGTDNGGDPSWTSTAKGTYRGLAMQLRSFTIVATSAIYYGATAFAERAPWAPEPTGVFVWEHPSTLQAGFGDVLSRTLAFGGEYVVLDDEYLWIAAPNQPQYSGGPSAVEGGGDYVAFVNKGTGPLTRGDSTRNYRFWRSTNRITGEVSIP